MAEKNAPATKKAAPKKSAAKKAPVKKAAVSKKAQENVTIEDMHRLLSVLEDGLLSRDKALDHLQKQIEQNAHQAAQNQKIIAKRGLIYKFTFALLAIGVISATYSQHTVIKSFDDDMTNVSNNMDVMRADMSAMRIAMESMSKDMHSMSGDFGTVAKDVSTISKGVTEITKDVKSMSYGVRGMSQDTRDMNRSMDTMTPPWSPFR